jgi:catecholate siderophore receptor
MRFRSVLVVILASVLPLHAAAAAAQSLVPEPSARTGAGLDGTVVDPDGRAVASAQVELIGERGGSRTSVRTRDDGRFTFDVAAGRYSLSIQAPGFAPLIETLELRGRLTREFPLVVAGVREDVTVTAPAPVHGSSISSATRTATPLLDVPQSISVVTRAVIRDQMMTSMADVVRYVPGISSHQGENNRDQVIIRGNNSSADFFVDGIRDDVQYYRDLYNLERVEALKGPNAMIFGRGGGGGVINRVTKEPIFEPVREVALTGGSFDHKRFSADFGQAAGMRAAFRVNAMYEDSDSFRTNVGLTRYAVNPTVMLLAGATTHVTLGYEHLHDDRTADRGIPSLNGRPLDVDIRTFYGNPHDSSVRADVDLASAAIGHAWGKLTIRNRTLAGNYDRGYQNYVPGAVTADGTRAALTAYNNRTRRVNVFNQTDLTYPLTTGRLRHVLLAGAELGRQLTDNRRNTGYFENSATSVLVPVASPTIATPVTFRPSATDADNHVTTSVAAAYVQDQIDLSARVQAIAGVRIDRFDLEYHNNRSGDDLRRVDSLVSPRVGLIFKPTDSSSLYGSYAVSFLPSAGDQFSSLTTITQQVKPERFANYEAGAKWNLTPELALTAAVYRLDRTNTRSTDPNDPTRIVQTGSQRSDGLEFGANGHLTSRWQLVGGYAYQDARVTSATVSARVGARVAQVPRHSWSLWNLYQLHPKLGAGLGIVRRTDVFAAIDNTVVLPAYTDIDAAVYLSLTSRTRLQLNVENVFDRVYYVNADSNTNISPGMPRSVRIGLTTGF